MTRSWPAPSRSAVQLRRLGTTLLSLRTDQGLTRRQVSDRTGVKPDTIFRVEGGLARPRPRTLDALLTLYQVDSTKRQALMRLSVVAARPMAWLREFHDVLPAAEIEVAELEDEARTVYCYSPLRVPDLLQTPGYTRAVRHGMFPSGSDRTAESLVLLTAGRQKALRRGRRPLRLRVVCDEAVLHRLVGGPDIMRDQLRHLVEMTSRPNITLQLLPFGAGAYPGMTRAFSVIDTPDDAGAVHVDEAGAGRVLTTPHDVHGYTNLFDHLRRAALPPEASAELLLTVAADSYGARDMACTPLTTHVTADRPPAPTSDPSASMPVQGPASPPQRPTWPAGLWPADVTSGKAPLMATDRQRPSARIDTTRPHSARVWNYWLGGKDHYAADRAAGDEIAAILPTLREQALADRAFLGRVVRYLAGEVGIRQFIDIGTGLPTMDNTHEVAQRVAPECRIVYVDNDPLVLTHARALLTSSPEGVTDYIDADLRDPDTILAEAAAVLDLSEPVGLLLLGVLHHVDDYEEARSCVARLMDRLSPGSFVAINHATEAVHGPVAREAADLYNAANGTPRLTLRTPEQIRGLFDGLELLEPGVVTCSRWRPEHSDAAGRPVDEYCGLARKGGSW